MTTNRYISQIVSVGASLGLCFNVAFAKVDAETAKRLKTDLTPLGAQRVGNATGTIPSWDGGIQQPPANYKPGSFHPDPFASDQVMFRINAENLSQYENNLSEGQKALIKAYSNSYFLPVYPSRRSASYPQDIYTKLYENALTAELLENGNGVRKTIATSPFPIPADGIEVLWNHSLRYRGEQASFRMAFATPNTGGAYTPIQAEYNYFFAYSEPGAELEDIENKIFYLRTKILSPAKLAGTLSLVHETLDQVRSPRSAWRYESGERRLRRSPNLEYSTELPNSEGFRSVDQKDLYNGAPNQYEWTLLGKKEIYIPYNAYRFDSAENSSAEKVIRPLHINQDLTRYELHRVWVVEGVLREGLQHIYHKRRFYADEDTWQIVLTEEYDDKNQLWRVSEAHSMNYYEIPVVWTTLELTYDLKAKRYYVDGLDKDAAINFSPNFDKGDFTTSAARRDAKR